jgi:hypothetical protein
MVEIAACTSGDDDGVPPDLELGARGRHGVRHGVIGAFSVVGVLPDAPCHRESLLGDSFDAGEEIGQVALVVTSPPY